MAEAVLAPSTSGSVVLDLGPGTGALVLHTPPELDGEEIEISMAGPAGGSGGSSPLASAAGSRTHSQVRQRLLPDRVQYAAVYPGLPAGDYTIWRDASTPAAVVTVAEAGVTSAHWPALTG